MNNCPKCGAMNDENSTTCQICGSMLNINMENNNPDIEINQKEKPNVFSYLNNENITLINNQEKKEDNKPIEINKKENIKKNDQKLLLPFILLIIIIICSLIAAKNIISPKKKSENLSMTYKNDSQNYVKEIESYMQYSIQNKDNSLTYSIKNRSFEYKALPTSNKCILDNFSWTGSEKGPITCSSFMKDINDNYCQLENKSCHVPDSATIYFNQEGKILENTEFIYDDYICTYNGDIFTCTK